MDLSMLSTAIAWAERVSSTRAGLLSEATEGTLHAVKEDSQRRACSMKLKPSIVPLRPFARKSWPSALICLPIIGGIVAATCLLPLVSLSQDA